EQHRQRQEHREPGTGQAGPALRDATGNEEHRDPLEEEHARGRTAQRPSRPHRVGGGHAERPVSRVRASPAVITLPVTSTPDPPRASSGPASASSIASSSASGRFGETLTRSAPNTTTASAPSSSAGMARGELFWVTTSSAQISSSAASIPATSLPRTAPTTPTSRVKS